MFKKIMATALAIMMFTSINAFAVDTYGGYNVPVDIDVNGNFIKCDEKPILIDGTTYIPLRAFSNAICGTIGWDENESAATLTKDEHIFVFYPEKNYSIIDGEKMSYTAIFHNDLTFIPVRAVSDVLGYSVKWDDFYLTVKITAPTVEVPENLIDYSYTYDDIMYLGKITHIESGYQRFDVKLGVAGTVVNRVKSSQFPNTIKDVIFDTKYSVQFPPAHTEKINTIPSKESIIAAKCALNGINIVGNSLYFVDTKYAPSSWAHNNRPYYTTIYDMSFYE